MKVGKERAPPVGVTPNGAKQRRENPMAPGTFPATASVPRPQSSKTALDYALESSETAFAVVWATDLLLERLGDWASDPNPVTLRLLQQQITRTAAKVQAAK